MIGPNAFALPGGTIIITDQMIEFAESQEEILAILAHELGHVEERHILQLVVQSSFAALVAATVTADAASLSALVAGIPAILLQKKYSRDFEDKADEYAFDMLKRHDVSPEAFASIMERIDDNKESMRSFSFMDTHPITEERIRKARDSAVSQGRNN
jgi:predicted Zn-dependent protease